ncbi:hypothetical protein Ahy_B02g060082 [Arachis hypogaea]|uniref:Calcium-transporting P-type ATPase N-terminal autoinhibitory domain-containing protein n=1 Tax=Arachis hypogaea TaxID=3818 RepID=A0A445AHW4_ARAHY|nr:hypothetical protein Ahy_B02g060082 [Arachis hypogaea]
MDNYLKEFELEPKDRSIEALSRWRSAVSAWVIKNRRRRFRNVVDLVKLTLAEEKKKKIQLVEILFQLENESNTSKVG